METEMKKKISIAVIAGVGILTTIKLAIIYYNANFNPYALSSFCSVNEFIESRLTNKDRVDLGLVGFEFHRDDFISWWFMPRE